MLLLWLLLVPSARATIECHSACGLCAMDSNPQTAACTLCRECHKVHRLMTGRNNQMLSSRQDQALKDLERREFRQLMKEYGWVPEDLVDSDSRVEKLADKECLPPPSKCINDEEDNHKRLAYSPTICPTLPYTQNYPAATTCKNKLNNNKRKPNQKKLSIPLTKSTMPLMIMGQIVTLQYEEVDQGSPTETTCSDSDNNESGEPLYDESATEPSKRTTCRPKKLTTERTISCMPCYSTETTCPDSDNNESGEPLYDESATEPTTRTTCRPKKLTTERTISCVPCMPLCPLPCGTPVSNSPILPSIPPDALEALMTLKPTTIYDNKIITTQTSESIEEKIDERIQKLVLKHTSNVYIEDTTKDYVYLYVGIPKHERYG